MEKRPPKTYAGRYKAVSLLGEGQFSKVYEVEDIKKAQARVSAHPGCSLHSCNFEQAHICAANASIMLILAKTKDYEDMRTAVRILRLSTHLQYAMKIEKLKSVGPSVKQEHKVTALTLCFAVVSYYFYVLSGLVS